MIFSVGDRKAEKENEIWLTEKRKRRKKCKESMKSFSEKEYV